MYLWYCEIWAFQSASFIWKRCLQAEQKVSMLLHIEWLFLHFLFKGGLKCKNYVRHTQDAKNRKYIVAVRFEPRCSTLQKGPLNSRVELEVERPE